MQKRLEMQRDKGLLSNPKITSKKTISFRKKPTYTHQKTTIDRSKSFGGGTEDEEIDYGSVPISPKDQLMWDVDELLKDKDQLKSFQKMFESKSVEKSNNEVRLMQSKKMMIDLQK